MENKLWVFGDSNTAGILPDISHFGPYIEYRKYLGISEEDFPEGWAYQLSKKLNMDYENFGVGGSSNNETFIKVAKNSHNFKKGDIVIINWTYLHRFLWALPKDRWDVENMNGKPFGKFRRVSINPHIDEELKAIVNNTDVYPEIGLNYSLESWIDVIHSYENIIDSLSNSMEFDVYYWSAEHIIHTSLGDSFSNKKYICNDCVAEYINQETKEIPYEHIPSEAFQLSLKKYGVTTIHDETNGENWDNYHLGIKGNEAQCSLFYNWIVKNRNKGLYN